MKKITKILTILASSVTVLTTVPLMASCNKKNGMNAVSTNLVLGGSSAKDGYLEFSLKNELSDGQTLLYSINNQTSAFKFGKLVIDKTNVRIPVEAIDTTNPNDFQFTVTFECMNSNSVKIWDAIFTDCSVSYSNLIKVNGDKKVRTNLNESYYLYELELDEEIGEDELTINAAKMSGTDGVNISTETSVVGKTVSLKVEMSKNGGSLAGEDFVNFKLNINRTKDGTQIWYTSIIDMKITYSSELVPVDENAYKVETIDNKKTLTAIDDSKITGTMNYMNMTSDALKDVEVIADNLFWDAGTSIGKHEAIKYIKFNDKCNNFGKNAFRGANFKMIDLSSMQDDAEWFAKGEFGDNAFANFKETYGNIVYNSQWSNYKIQHINRALYKAGLTSQNWYDVKIATNIPELREYLETGGFIKLSNAVTTEANWTITNGRQLMVRNSSLLDLNGQVIRWSPEDPTVTDAAVGIWNDSELVVQDSSDGGAITCFGAAGEIAPVFEVKLANPKSSVYSLTLSSGIFEGKKNCVINHNAQFHIEGGYFHVDDTTLQKYFEERAEDWKLQNLMFVNKSEDAKMYIWGGLFFGYTQVNEGTLEVIPNDFNPTSYIGSQEYEAESYNVGAGAYKGENFWKVKAIQ